MTEGQAPHAEATIVKFQSHQFCTKVAMVTTNIKRGFKIFKRQNKF